MARLRSQSHGPNQRCRFLFAIILRRPRWILLVTVAVALMTVWMLSSESSLLSTTEPSLPEMKSFYVASSHVETINVQPGVSIQSSSSSTLCRSTNALVILAQKKHATYGRDSLGFLVRTLDLLRDNYLAIHQHADNVDLFLFHTGDFDKNDFIFLEQRLRGPSGMLRFVDLTNTTYWSLAAFLQHDNPNSWKGSEIYPIGYRHMCRFFGMQLWQFFHDLNLHGNCHYRYIARLDEDSFLLSPIHYDLFEFMLSQHYVYGYRMCAYEFQDTLPKIWFKKWQKSLHNTTQRAIGWDMCGFYTNFFIADLQFFTSPPVSKLLQDIDRRGFFYRKRFGDLLVHSLAVYAFAPPAQIHRFLDFTYQHVTIDYFKDAEKECISWGSIQAGHDDPNGEDVVNQFYHTHVVQKKCPTANLSWIQEEDLSPTYAHISDSIRQKNKDGKIKLKTVHAGKVEVPNQGILSG